MTNDKQPMSVGKFVPDSVKGGRLYGMARDNKHEVKRFGKFAVVGLSGLFIDIVLLNLFERNLHMPVSLAIACAFAVAAVNNFTWTRLWVYPESRATPKRKQMPVFLAVNTAGLLINELIFLLFQTPITSLVALAPIAFVQLHFRGIGLNVTKLIAAVIVMLWNFFVNRFVTFRNVKWQTNATADEPTAIESVL